MISLQPFEWMFYEFGLHILFGVAEMKKKNMNKKYFADLLKFYLKN